MTLLLWQFPDDDNPIIECWGSRYGVQYYRVRWKNISKHLKFWKKGGV